MQLRADVRLFMRVCVHTSLVGFANHAGGSPEGGGTLVHMCLLVCVLCCEEGTVPSQPLRGGPDAPAVVTDTPHTQHVGRRRLQGCVKSLDMTHVVPYNVQAGEQHTAGHWPNSSCIKCYSTSYVTACAQGSSLQYICHDSVVTTAGSWSRASTTSESPQEWKSPDTGKLLCKPVPPPQ